MSNNKKKRNQNKKRAGFGNQKKPQTWMIIAIIAIVFAVGLVVKTAYFPSGGGSGSGRISSSSSEGAPLGWDASLSTPQVLAVAAQFRCACGGCGEKQLEICHCDMDRGALEEKTFIRDRLLRGMSVAEVADLLEIKYGHRNT